ncbi:S8 family serine peptidase [Lentibacillus sp. N15]|uniref:S8 family serine peptidase n=1 Tax=Lentibacillus songyuanensis TaxID=3136161 RepID=UPI0031BBB95D
MIISLLSPGMVGAESKGKPYQSLHDAKTTAKAKVSNRLLDEFDKNDKATFLIKFKQKADTKKAAKKAKKSASKAKLTTHKAEIMQRSAIVSELKSTSLESQQSVKDYLDKQVKKGKAEHVKSYFIVNGMAVTATKEVAKKIASFQEVEKVLPNEKRQIFKTKVEDAPKATEDVEWNVDRVGATQAWDMGFDGTGTVVASIDTGVQWDHPALKEKYRGYDAATGDVDHNFNWFDATTGEEEPYDDVGHGTHVTGTMVGGEADGSNQVGVAPGAKFISVKAFTEQGGTDTDLLNAAEWILAPTDADGNTRVDMAPDVVNNSWGGGPGLDEWYRDVVIHWSESNIFPEFSAGNTDLFNPGGPGSVAAPANYPESFATGATDSSDVIADFSLRGPSPYDEIKPDISAPGVGIRSTLPGDDYGAMSGTSMAGPAVSGVAALLRQVDGNMSVDEMKKTLLDTATPLTDEEYPETPNNGYGNGLVNAYDAISSMENGIGTLEGRVAQQGDDKQAHLGVVKDHKAALKGKNNQATVPLEAKVSVLESGRTVSTNPEDGTYSLTHPAGEFTVQAEAYGFNSEQQSVTIEKEGTTKADFTLKEIAEGTIEGTITNKQTDEPIEGATILLEEDANVQPVQTDKDGHYSLSAYEGSYTLKVMASDFHSKEIDVTIGKDDQTIDIDLDPFYSYPGGEIGYDDGTAENARAFYDAGNGWGVKMTLPEGKDTAVVTDGVFRFWDTEWPVPGGTEFAVEVWDASGEDGAPGKKVAGPIDAEAMRNGEWTVVDLSEHNIVVDGDFYMVYIQTEGDPNAPGLATDEDGTYAERSFQLVDGTWSPSPADEGNYMIRARVSYEVADPVITSPDDDLITNEKDVTIEGTASPTTTIQLMNNGDEAGTAEVAEDGTFAIEIKLTEGENEFTAVSKLDGDKTGASKPVTVTLDTNNPELTIDNPKDGDKTNHETVTVEGTVQDANLDWVKVNGEKAKVTDGAYSKRILLDNGENKIKVVAKDQAGNKTKKNVKLDVNMDVPVIDNLTPTDDVQLQAGESVKIEFDSDPGLDATFFVQMPLTNAKASLKNVTELPLRETSEGHYVGYWTATNNVEAEGAVIEVKVTDDYGNETRQTADGKLFINVDNK